MGLLPLAKTGQYIVQFYQSEHYLLHVITDFVLEALSLGEKIIIIASPARRRKFLHSFSAFFDVSRAFKNEQLIFMDAQEVLGKIMVNGQLDGEMFERLVSPLVQELPKNAPGIKIYCEMVSLLWNGDDSRGMAGLEGLWSKVCQERKLTLLCAYGGNSHPVVPAWREPAPHQFLH